MDQSEQTPQPELQNGVATLLCVDDEVNILSSLKRLFRPHGYRVLTATSGEQGLAVLSETEIDLVISDMRMPEMDGACFLEQVRQRWPDTMRILLTGYSDIASTIAAVNRGEIYRYLSKPWLDDDVILLVKQALELRNLAREKTRLEELTRKQNHDLVALNAGLEDIVAQRTAALHGAMESLEQAHDKLKKSFITSITMFSNLIELREGVGMGHSRRVVDLARRMAQKLKVGDAELQDITVAALLRNIGKLALPDSIVNKAREELSSEEWQEVSKHPIKGQAALMALDQLAGAARLIRSQHERYDGMGYPDRLSGSIPQGARILAVAGDYYGLQRGLVTKQCLTATQARAFIVDGRGKRYDPYVVDAFVDAIEVIDGQPVPVAEKQITSAQLRVGMVLTRDLLTRDGILLLGRDYVLDAALIEKIRDYEETDANPVNIHVRLMKVTG